jgi:sulfonate transport system substrate-binding protein
LRDHRDISASVGWSTLGRREFFLAGLALIAVFAANGSHAAAIPDKVPAGTTLAIGDPYTQQALILSGEIGKLPFKVEWANISGGPRTIQAFRAHALDLGAVADIPPIHANWTGLPVKIVAARFRQDPIAHPVYQIGVAPGAQIRTLADLRGKRIAYSPGQAQGALILRILNKVGLRKQDVKLVELPSTTDVYANALAGKLVDAAPLGVMFAKRYLVQYGRDGGRAISHGLRDDAAYLYAPTSVLADPAKAAAIREYIKIWARAWRWVGAHPAQWAQGFYVVNQGLTPGDAKFADAVEGVSEFPAHWDDVIKRQQETVDLLAQENHQPRLNAADLFDRRFETVAASALAGR